MSCELKIRTWATALAAVAVLSGMTQEARGGGVPLPDLGVTWAFDCGEESPWNGRYSYTPKSVRGEILAVDWTAGDDQGRMSIPVSALYTGFHAEKVLGSRITKQAIESGSLSFEAFQVGEKRSAWVRQNDSKWGRNRWKWTSEIKERRLVETWNAGSLEIYVIENTRYSKEWRYGSKRIFYYAPELNFVVYQMYSDTDNNIEECYLTSRTRSAAGGQALEELPVPVLIRPSDTTAGQRQKALSDPSAYARVAPAERRRIEIFFETHEPAIKSQLAKYNERNRIAVASASFWHGVRSIESVEVLAVEGELAMVRVAFVVGRRGAASRYQYDYKVRLSDDRLEIVDHLRQ